MRRETLELYIEICRPFKGAFAGVGTEIRSLRPNHFQLSYQLSKLFILP